jgi:restriction system protein
MASSGAGARSAWSSDGGIDGIIREDRLGLDVIYVQAKRWQNPVTPRVVREFVGALEDAGARKGVFITTSRFTREAQELADRRRIVMIDGRRLAQFMIEAGVGVEPIRSYQIAQINEDYFSGEDDPDSS